MVILKQVKDEDKELLGNLNQKYLYEMTNYYPDTMDELGNYHYGYFDEYFIDHNRHAYFIYNDGMLVGFAMINPYSYIDKNPDYVMGEFTIFPSYRRKHFAIKAIGLIFSMYPGKWEIKFNEKNVSAKSLWESLTIDYHPIKHRLNNFETVLEFKTV